MKKLLSVGILLFLLSAATMAQRNMGDLRARRVELSRLERIQLQRDLLRYRIMERHMDRERVTGPMERRKLYKLKRKNRNRNTGGRLI